MSKVLRKVLTLNERVDILKQLESGKSSRKIALQFGRTQIQSIAIRKANVLEDYYNNRVIPEFFACHGGDNLEENIIYNSLAWLNLLLQWIELLTTLSSQLF